MQIKENTTIRRCYINGKKAAVLKIDAIGMAFLLTNIAAFDNCRDALRKCGYSLHSFAAATAIDGSAEIAAEIALVFGGSPQVIWENTPEYNAIIQNRSTRKRAKKA